MNDASSRPVLDISHVKLGERPLVVCDVDDVVLQFLAPFQDFLRQQGHELLPRSFKLTGNIVSLESRIALEHLDVRRLIEDFFDAQEQWQIPFELGVDTLNELSSDADILFLTAMPPKFQAQRRRLLDALGLAFPLLASEDAKGPIVHLLHASRALPVTFIDDMAHNLHSVRDSVADCLLLQMMPDSEIHRLAPPPGEGIVRARDWPHAAELIRSHIGS